jgi:hypothetical protein
MCQIIITGKEEVVVKPVKLRTSYLKEISLPAGPIGQWYNCKLEVDFFYSEVKVQSVILIITDCLVLMWIIKLKLKDSPYMYEPHNNLDNTFVMTLTTLNNTYVFDPFSS